jgi:hypothetical protein
MAQGIFVDSRRAKSKKAVKDAVRDDPSRVALEGVAITGKDFDGPITEAPVGKYYFVGPDPYNDRRFYGQIIKTDSGIKVS